LESWQTQFCKKGSECQYYGGEYDPAHLELGVCPVNVPSREHQAGIVERPCWYESGESPDKHFSITTLTPLGSEQFFADLNQRLFSALILAAPDVNRVGCLQGAAQILPKVGRRVTLYSSSADKALQASKTFHQFPRAGDVGSEPVVCEGIDTIDASDAETDL